MPSKSLQAIREDLLESLTQCRQGTLGLVSGIDNETFCKQAHADFSPIGWHLGHIAYTESYWILERCAGLSAQFPEYHQLFAADGLPKNQRQNLPTIETILNYLHNIRKQVLRYLDTAPIKQQARLWLWLLQHESQHNETMTLIQELHQRSQGQVSTLKYPQSISLGNWEQMVEIPSGFFELGSDRLEAQDNERPTHRIYLETYWIDAYPVTCKQYRQFIMAEGYQKRQFWSEEGWRWLQNNPVSQPLYWVDSAEWDAHPVYGINWYEAQAYCKFVGKRLPTEAEWEKAASWDATQGEKRPYPWGNEKVNAKLSNYDGLVGHTTPVNAHPQSSSAYGCYDMLGNVWEWTASSFAPYPDFTPYPYGGYSANYFDAQHRVLRGGSWATRPWGLRNSFRNWYYPCVRQIFAGFRCVRL